MISPSLITPPVNISQLIPPLPQSSLYKPGCSRRFSKYLHGSVSRWASKRTVPIKNSEPMRSLISMPSVRTFRRYSSGLTVILNLSLSDSNISL